MPHRADQTVLRLGPGQFFGDQATLRGQKGALTCHAVKRSILLAVDRTALRDLLDSGPTWAASAPGPPGRLRLRAHLGGFGSGPT